MEFVVNMGIHGSGVRGRVQNRLRKCSGRTFEMRGRKKKKKKDEKLTGQSFGAAWCHF